MGETVADLFEKGGSYCGHIIVLSDVCRHIILYQVIKASMICP